MNYRLPFLYFIAFICFLHGLFYSNHAFQIISPMELALDEDASIKITINTFGLPYATHRCSTFRVIASNPHNACSSLVMPSVKRNAFGINYLNTFRRENNIPVEDEEPLAILIQRGECNFSQKVSMAEKFGFRNIIFWNNKFDQDPQIITDDGTGTMLRSRMVLIPRTLGLKMVEWLEKHPDIPIRVRLGNCANHSYY